MKDRSFRKEFLLKAANRRQRPRHGAGFKCKCGLMWAIDEEEM
jgi:hypothetical protein